MSILNTISLESNKKIKINFNGGNLSSDGGLLLIKEFAAKVGLIKLVKKLLKTNDHTNSRIHTDSDNLMQMLYQIIAVRGACSAHEAEKLYRLRRKRCRPAFRLEDKALQSLLQARLEKG